MLRFAEEIVLLLIDEDRGELPLGPARHTLHTVLAGAVLMDLALERRIETDLEHLFLVDPTPLGDELLDPALADIAGAAPAHQPNRDAGYWVAQIARRGEEIRERALARLIERGILETDVNEVVSFASSVSRTRRYPTMDGSTVEEVRLRIMRVLFGDDLPDPRDIVIICLVDACGLFRRLLSRAERDEARSRIELLRRMDLIGQAVTKAVAQSKPPSRPKKPAARPAAEAPQARGFPLLGSALALSRDQSGFLTRQYRELGPVFRVRTPGRNWLVLAGVEANLFLSRDGRIHLRSHETWAGFSADLSASRMLTGMDGAEHRRLRTKLAAGYSRERILSQIPEAVRVVREETRGWQPNRPVCVQRAMQRIVVEQLTVLLCGSSSREYLDDIHAWLHSALKVHVLRVFPRLMLRRPRIARARRRLEELVSKVLAAHAPEARRNGSPDLIDDLLDLHRHDPSFLPEADLTSVVLGPVVAGIDTSASVLAFVLYEALKRPELLERMTGEADELFRDGAPARDGLRHLDVTHRVAMETLRIRPAVTMVPRTVANSFEFGGYRVPAGTSVLVSTIVPHFLPEHFPEPERFDIERYAPGRAEHRKPGAYAPFGLGTHACLGRGLAEVQIALTLATILHDAELALDPPRYRLKVNQIPAPHAHRSFRVRLVWPRA